MSSSATPADQQAQLLAKLRADYEEEAKHLNLDALRAAMKDEAKQELHTDFDFANLPALEEARRAPDAVSARLAALRVSVSPAARLYAAIIESDISPAAGRSTLERMQQHDAGFVNVLVGDLMRPVPISSLATKVLRGDRISYVRDKPSWEAIAAGVVGHPEPPRGVWANLRKAFGKN